MSVAWKFAAWVCLGLASGRPALAGDTGFVPARWTHVAPVELPNPPARGLVEVSLPPEVLAVSQPGLADLRLADAAGTAVPYVVRTERDEQGPAATFRPQRLFNAVFISRQQSQVTVDFGPPGATAAASSNSRTRLAIDTPGTNFRRRVSVEAGPDGSAWQVLRETDWLFRITAESGSFEKNQVALPDNDFRYYRITVFNAPDDPTQVAINSVTAWHARRTVAQTPEMAPRTVDIAQDDKAHATVIDADLGYENVPLHDLAVAVEDGLFLRRVEILGRNVKTRTIVEPVENSQPRKREVEEPFTRLGTGAIYTLPGGREGQNAAVSLELPVQGQCRYVRVCIFNGDDAPLKVTGVKVHRLQSHLGFKAGAGPYRLFTGNPEAAAPVYDLETYAQRLRDEGVTVAALGPVAPNAQYAAQAREVPWSERHALLLWVTLGAVMAVLATLVLRQARHVKPMT